MSLPPDEQVKKALVSLAIEQALLEFGTPMLEEVTEMLLERYRCSIPDCYEKPEYLNKVLKEFFGNSYKVIVESIKKNLKDHSSEKTIEKFLKVISQ